MMKNIFALVFVFISAYAIAQQPVPAVKGAQYGAKINAKGALPVTQLENKMKGSETLKTKISGKVVDVCAKKGCWMKLEGANGQSTMIRFKDYGFFMPKDIVGKEVVMEGIAKQETTSVDDLRHYAKDGGKSKEEIAQITEPKKEVTFEATGVVVL